VHFGTTYVVRDGALHIRSGPLRWAIQIADITRVSATTDASSAPALSLDRISVQYRTGQRERVVLVSPTDRPAFVRALLSVKSGIAVTGGAAGS
jgi:hypothetical protein